MFFFVFFYIMYSYELFLLSFITFHCIAFSNNEKRNEEWWNGYKMSCLNYLLTLLFSSVILSIHIPHKDVFYIADLSYFIPHVFIADSIFYWTHRLCHTRLLYKIHKQHHKWNDPVSSSFLDANPVEHMIVNIPTVVIPLYLVKVSAFQQGLWIISVTINSITGHMVSYDSKQPHILHHKLRKDNYGAGGYYLMDRLMGTYRG